MNAAKFFFLLIFTLGGLFLGYAVHTLVLPNIGATRISVGDIVLTYLLCGFVGLLIGALLIRDPD